MLLPFEQQQKTERARKRIMSADPHRLSPSLLCMKEELQR